MYSWLLYTELTCMTLFNQSKTLLAASIIKIFTSRSRTIHLTLLFCLVKTKNSKQNNIIECIFINILITINNKLLVINYYL